MIITKSGNIEEVDLNKVRDKIKRLSEGLNVNYDEIAIKTVNGIMYKAIRLYKDRILKEGLKLHQDNCPDCGYVLKWIRREVV